MGPMNLSDSAAIPRMASREFQERHPRTHHRPPVREYRPPLRHPDILEGKLHATMDSRPPVPQVSDSPSTRERHVPTIEVVDSDSEEFGEQPPSVRRSRCEPTIVGQPPPAVAKRRRVPTKASKGRQIGVEGDQHRSRETHKPSSTPGPPAPARDGTNEPLRQCGNP